MEFIQEIGALAGLAAFLGLAVLALLYFAQARDVRRLRENASFLVEGGELPEAPEAVPETRAQPAAAGKDKAPAAAPAGKKPRGAEAFRRAELSRQAAERRERFERRRGSGRQRIGRGGEGRFSSLPEPGALVVIVVGVALLIAGVAFGASTILGGDEGGGKGGAAASEQVEIVVLNGTSEPGLAADFAKQLEKAGFTVDRTDNTSFPPEQSAVMYEKAGKPTARQVAQVLGLNPQPMLDQIRPDAAQAPVAVVLGDDKASGA